MTTVRHSGLKKPHIDHLDYDFWKSNQHLFGTDSVTLPENYNVDAGLTLPDQNGEGYPMGCTGYTSTDLCTDEDQTVYDAGYQYRITPPGTLTEGRDIRKSLKTTIDIGVKPKNGDAPGNKRTAYFNIRASQPLDMFDAIRVAMWATQNEKRAVSAGTPWFEVFNNPQNGILSTPFQLDVSNALWHNYAIKGWTTINNQTYLIVKPWCGPTYGMNGFAYMSRALCNTLFAIPGSAAFTLSKVEPGQIFTIDLTVIQRLVSFMRHLIGLS